VKRRKALMTPMQCKAARALLGWNQGKLAERIGFSTNMVSMFELGKFDKIAGDNMETMQDVLEEAGAVFVSTNGVMLYEDKSKW